MTIRIREGVEGKWYKPGEIYSVTPALVGYRTEDGRMIYQKDCTFVDALEGTAQAS